MKESKMHNFNELTPEEKSIYSSGFKTAYLIQQKGIKLQKDKLNELLNYSIPISSDEIKKDDVINNNINTEL